MTTQKQKSFEKKLKNDGLHIEEIDGVPVLKDGKGRTISGGGGGEPAQYLKNATSVNGVLTITKKDGSTVVQDVTDKMDKLGDVPGAPTGTKYRFPFHFDAPVQNADNVAATFHTVVPDTKQNGGDFTVTIPAADPANNKAGVYTKTHADAKSKVAVSTSSVADVDTVYSIEVDGVKHNLPGANFRMMTLGFSAVAGEPGKYEGILSAPGIYSEDEVMALYLSGYGYVVASGALSGGEKGEMWFLPSSNYENNPALTAMYTYAVKGGTTDIVRYKLTAVMEEPTPGTKQVKATVIEDPIGGGSGGMETVEITLTPYAPTQLRASLTSEQFNKLAGGNARLKGTATLPNGTWTLWATDMEKQAYTVGETTKYNLYGQLITASDGQIAGIYIREKTGTETGDYTLIATLRNFMTEVTGGRFIGWWDAVEGKPSEIYLALHASFVKGDMFKIGRVATETGETNHKPTGTSWEQQVSTETEGSDIGVNEFYVYEGSGVWNFYAQTEFDLTYDRIQGDPLDSPAMENIIGNLFQGINSLADEIAAINTKGRLLGKWNNVTGLAHNPVISAGFTYQAGDYFIIETLGTTQQLMPYGTTYSETASTTAYSGTETVALGDYWVFDGLTWDLAAAHAFFVDFKNVAGDPADNPELMNAIRDRQAKIGSGTAEPSGGSDGDYYFEYEA